MHAQNNSTISIDTEVIPGMVSSVISSVISSDIANFKRLATVAMVTLLYGCSSGGSGGDGADTNQTTIFETETGNATLLVAQPQLNWTDCVGYESIECASLLVPLDYSNLEGETISVSIARGKTDRVDQTRTLIINPGGPGGDGLSALESIIRFGSISTQMKDTFNFVSFDPRGVGETKPLNCDTTDFFSLDLYPANRDEIALNFTKQSNFAQDCIARSPNHAEHVGSNNVVRDINEMRKALGLTQIDFLGYSYGTRLAALYMQAFPQSTGRFVLDGSMRPDPFISALALGSLQTGQANINGLAQACIGVPVVCIPDQFATDLQNRVTQLSTAPESRESLILFGLLRIASTVPGYEQLLISPLARYLETGDVSELDFLDRNLGLSESAEDTGGVNITALIAVMCADDPTRPTVESIDELRLAFDLESDLLGELQLPTAGMCAGWPESADPIPQIATNQAPASLVIGGPSDSQTPLIFAEQMAAAVGGQFLRSEHDGHTTVFTPKNRCTNNAVETFLLTGSLPASSVCEADITPTLGELNWQDQMRHN